jgi:hypothetical protein
VTEANVMYVAKAVRYCLFILRLFNNGFNGQSCIATKEGVVILKSMDAAEDFFPWVRGSASFSKE